VSDKVLSAVDSVLPEDGPVWQKHIAHKHRMYIYFNDVFKHFNEHFSELNMG
jgi:hypothetical protein